VLLHDHRYRQSLSGLADNIAGTVFDSSPIDVTERAIAVTAKDTLPGVLGSGLLAVFRLVQYMSGQDPKKRRQQFADRIMGNIMQTPELYLYSSSDPIADCEFIERYGAV
jgi:Eukaryotic protein of unknown function (DUF829)